MGQKRFKVTALTPVHIGTGETIAPEEYFTDDRTGELVRFHPGSALLAMQANERQAFSALIDQNRMKDAVEKMRTAARRSADAQLYRVRLSSGSKQDLQSIVGNLELQRGEVRPLPRNPHTGKIVVPGSAIKGAVRTAVMNDFIAGLTKQDPSWKQRVEGAPKFEMKRMWGEVQQAAFGAQKPGEALERDPFRHLKVSDMEVSKERAIVSRARIYKREGDAGQEEQIRMYYERLESLADGASGELGEVTITVVESEDRQNQLGKVAHPLSWKLVGMNCNQFFVARWEHEKSRFDWLYRGWQADWKSSGRPAFLLRLGRFNHFESLSVDTLRRGQGYQGRDLFEGGNSRTACEMENGRKTPFGWVMLEELPGA